MLKPVFSTTFRNTSKVAAGLICAVFLSGCGGMVDRLFVATNDSPLEDQTPEAIYALAQQNLTSGDQKVAAFYFDEVERLYPYSDVSKEAMLMSALASYEAQEYNDAIIAGERYIGYYPSDEQAAYARWIIAQSYYDQIVDVGRDQGLTRQASAALEELIARHPQSGYARDAQLKLDTTRDQLAGKEMDVGRYYLKRANYIAAINRFQTVVNAYDTTTHVEEALHRLVEANLALGLVEEAKAAGAVLGHNYPGGQWYSDSYAMLTGSRPVGQTNDGWMGSIYRRVVKGDWL